MHSWGSPRSAQGRWGGWGGKKYEISGKNINYLDPTHQLPCKQGAADSIAPRIPPGRVEELRLRMHNPIPTPVFLF